ncbi:NAD(P)-binding protein [Halobacillus shinanisalinarum]|uniref:precorrin-2 dehydrogenase n=1 Tax=Halobacillus shinanisalinarum TaxID=2932258 RepID=A0ABY4H179_9BACI|nr:NAD(P)-binding protein [Halobacillus shinanisalinarum]UOQ93899.1 NAD(P)-binding protein [Halobacillus shinanisalinarum]
MTLVPLMLDLKGKKVVVIGGGHVAKRRVDSLLDTEAFLTVISPKLIPELIHHHEKARIDWKQKYFSPDDVEGAFLIITATNNRTANRIVVESAPSDCLINAADEADAGNVHFPAHFERGKLTVAISTQGASPLLAKKIKKDLSCQYDERYEQYLDFLFEVRQLLKQSSFSHQERNNYLHKILSEVYLDPQTQKEMLHSLEHYIKNIN